MNEMGSVGAGSSVLSQTVTCSIHPEVDFRFLCPEDIPQVKRLCAEWFPIEYPDVWYEDITSSSRFYSLAATYNSHIVGMIVCEVKRRVCCNKEDMDILASHFMPTTQVAYILSLGVENSFRRYGIASLLLENLITYLTTSEFQNCKAVYLHVLTTNTAAIKFYERHKFHLHNFLPYYYSIKGKPYDGFSYVLYINGGQPPWSFVDYIKQWMDIMMSYHICGLPTRLLQTTKRVWRRLFPSSSNIGLQQIRYS